jgi:AraC family transcriptional regulator
VRHTGPYDQCGQAWEALCMNLGAQGWIGANARFIGLCHDDPDVTPADRIRYDACVTIGEGFQPEGAVGVQLIEGGDYAMTVHNGPYERLSETYARLCGQWVPRSGRTVRAAPGLEVYLTNPEDTAPEDLVTEVYMPLEPLEED